MILYFSGTGNCKYVAERIASAVGDTAVSVEDSDGVIALKKGEILGMVFPTHFWEVPAIMREFLEKASITAGGENYVFAIATYGTTPGCSGTDAKKLLQKKGIDLSAAFSLKMPDNWTPMFDLSDAEKVRRQNEEADKNLAVQSYNIKAMVKGNHATPKAPYIVLTMSDQMYLKARRTSNFSVEDACIGCGLCAKQCPVQAIKIQNGKPVWIKE
ncbi:MAG: EFR1 family ferrodoxin, partial [Ruminococcus sp.]|nr:EFR1 family ferrodoxin [Ruminococcus sp.]